MKDNKMNQELPKYYRVNDDEYIRSDNLKSKKQFLVFVSDKKYGKVDTENNLSAAYEKREQAEDKQKWFISHGYNVEIIEAEVFDLNYQGDYI